MPHRPCASTLPSDYQTVRCSPACPRVASSDRCMRLKTKLCRASLDSMHNGVAFESSSSFASSEVFVGLVPFVPACLTCVLLRALLRRAHTTAGSTHY
eukprot:6203490-Pleurochrysis_carterae.AAC.7